MKSTSRLHTGNLFVLTVFLSQIILGCTGEPSFVETSAPESRIVVLTDSQDNCDSSQSIDHTFTTEYSRSKKTSWSVEGKTGVGGKIPLGFFVPSLDIEAAVTSRYGSEDTRTWVSTYSHNYTIPGQMKTVMAAYYQETTQKGIINYFNKQIEYEYPAELIWLGARKADIPCNQPGPIIIMCAQPIGGAPSTVPEQVAALEGNWRLRSPSNGELSQINIDIQGFQVLIHVWANGASDVADWGIQPQCTWSDRMEVTFDHLRYKTTTLTLRLASAGRLHVTAVDRYIDPPVFIPAQTTEYIFTQSD